MRLRRYVLPLAIAAATVAAFVVVASRTAGDAVSAASSPNWPLLACAFAFGAVVQPLRALAWRQLLGRCVEFRAIYAASAIGSFLDTVLPGRLGEAGKVAVLRAASAERWPGLPRAGGSLLATHLTEAIAFCLVGATAGILLPVPDWVRGALVGSVTVAAGVIVVAAALHHRLGRRLPAWADGFLAAAGAPRPVLLRALALLLAAWAMRWLGDRPDPERAGCARRGWRGARLHDGDRPRERRADPSRQRRPVPGRRRRGAGDGRPRRGATQSRRA